jgi:hypothetical protein
MAIAGQTGLDFGSGGVALKASGAVTADTNETAVYVGRGWFAVVVDVTAIDIASGDELYNIRFQANTAADTATYNDLAPALCLGAAAVIGGATASVTGKYVLGVFNPYDHQVRVVTSLNGTSPSVTFSADAFPLAVVAAF